MNYELWISEYHCAFLALEIAFEISPKIGIVSQSSANSIP